MNWITRLASAALACSLVSNSGAQENPAQTNQIQSNRVQLEFLPGLGSDGREPVAAMVQARDGALYGSTNVGGLHNHGTLYRVAPGSNPTIDVFYSFDEETYSPAAPMVVAADGNLYGVTNTWKKLYRVKPGPVPSVAVFPFSIEGSYESNDALVPAADGALYGTIPGDPKGAGGIYRVTLGATPKVTRVWTFKDGACVIQSQRKKRQGSAAIALPGSRPRVDALSIVIDSCSVEHLDLRMGSDGHLYGAAWGTGEENRGGFLYRFLPVKNPRVEILRTFDGKDGPWYPNSLIAAKNGKLYGTTLSGGARGLGSVFVIEPGAKPVVSTLLSIDSPEFWQARFVVANEDGRIYGISKNGGANGCGSAFALTLGATPKMETLLSFTAEKPEGNCRFYPAAATLAEGRGSALYGTVVPIEVYGDHAAAPGGIFKITTGAKPSAVRLISLTPEVGHTPVAPMVVASDGNLYGSTTKGARSDAGSIFQFTPKSSKLKSIFVPSTQSEVEPRSALALGADGALYGAAQACCHSQGIAFKVQGGNRPSVGVIHEFHANSSAGGPNGPLTAGVAGDFYGLASEGGQSSLGALYRLTAGSNATVSNISEFNMASGVKPRGPLISDGRGRFFGSTREGGTHNMGTVFMVNPNSKPIVSVLHSFDRSEGRPNDSGLVFAADGRLYGVATLDGAETSRMQGCGTLYRLSPDKSEFKVLHRFDLQSCWRQTGPVAAGKSLYIATLGNSSNDDGKVLRIEVGDKATVTSLGSFSQGHQFSDVSLYAGVDGHPFGVAISHGEDSGILFRINPAATRPVATEFSFDKALRLDSLVAGKDGYWYGTSRDGGARGKGALLRYKVGGKSIERLYSFNGKTDGAHPSTPLIAHTDGYLYGLTWEASPRSTSRGSMGRVFRFRPPARENR